MPNQPQVVFVVWTIILIVQRDELRFLNNPELATSTVKFEIHHR